MDSLKKGVVEGLVSTYKLIQISDEEYITSKKLREIGLYKKDINRFLKQIEDLVGRHEFFTIEQLFEMEKFELIDDFNFDERFYEEVIRVCNRFGSIQIDGSELYCVSKKKVNRFNFMEKYFNDVNDNIHIFDLVKKIENEYKIEVSQYTIKLAADELGYYYDDTFEKIYRNKESFLREVFDNENRY